MGTGSSFHCFLNLVIVYFSLFILPDAAFILLWGLFLLSVVASKCLPEELAVPAAALCSLYLK